MSLFLGIDIGTSGVKSVLVDVDDRVMAEARAPLNVQRPRPLWSEQQPDAWWQAVVQTLDDLATQDGAAMAAVEAIGLSGQMLGVALLDEDGRPLRPALLWNDGRAGAECEELRDLIPDFARITGSQPMPGFSAPKLRWLSKHEPDTLAAARWVLLPKDYVRLQLTGDIVTDLADGSATLLVDARRGTYHAPIIDHCGLDASRLPPIIASDGVGGRLRSSLASRWGLKPNIPVVGGAGDNMAGAVGAGIAATGQAFISLGTSGVYFVANHDFLPALDRGMHTHRHAIDGLFAQHGVVLSATAALSWIAEVTGGEDVGALVSSVEANPLSPDETPVFTPYLAGERTPHNDPTLTASFAGMTFATTRRHLVQSVMEGVALALGGCHEALLSSGVSIEQVALVGGGSRSRYWSQLIASVIDRPMTAPLSAVVGPALGAARLARKAMGGDLIADKGREVAYTTAPCPRLADALGRKKSAYSSLRMTLQTL
ncbi:xylulokinase [Microvirga puerhi]|uniref:Xylulose kinase n=1 Tax=Microvirga puerhi TaxID=2876078 RepID=A0ABS7VS33_9HYPH|nr:xylulokinase [Microvirga puerhi]MBZ6077880.1 xylulokinase [Microvirga puerhi]